MTANEMWKEYKRRNQNINEENIESWAFGEKPDLLAKLVLKGKKTATSSAYDLYEIEQEPLPQVGKYSIILDSNDEAVCIIQTTSVYIVAFQDVSEEHAFKEGEGDCSLMYWRQVHEKFFKECLQDAGVTFDESMKVVCEEFKVVYQ